jgi:hypothetical protein
VVPAPPGAEPDAADASHPRASRGGLHLSGFGAATNAEGSDFMFGGRLAAAFGLGSLVWLGPALTYAHGEDVGVASHLGLGGAVLGVGAPFGGRWVGASIEGGGGVSVSGFAIFTEPAGHSMTIRGDQTSGTAYARAALILQAPFDFAVRPTLSIAAMHVSDVGGSSAQLAMLDLGVAWPGF